MLSLSVVCPGCKGTDPLAGGDLAVVQDPHSSRDLKEAGKLGRRSWDYSGAICLRCRSGTLSRPFSQLAVGLEPQGGHPIARLSLLKGLIHATCAAGDPSKEGETQTVDRGVIKMGKRAAKTNRWGRRRRLSSSSRLPHGCGDTRTAPMNKCASSPVLLRAYVVGVLG